MLAGKMSTRRKLLHVKDVRKLLEIRPPGPLHWSVDIIGVIDILTEVLSFHDGEVFLARLTNIDKACDCGYIWLLVKDGQTRWQREWSPQMVMVVTQLVPASVGKFLDKEHYSAPSYEQEDAQFVLMPTSCSLWYADGSLQSTSSLQDWLSENLPEWKNGAMGILQDQQDRLLKTQHPKLISYKGKVTGCDDAEKGIVELDHKVRLYLSQPFLPVDLGPMSFVLGLIVTVHNAHQINNAQVSGLHLCCCGLTCIKTDSPCKVQSDNSKQPSSPWLELVQKYGMSWQQMDWMASVIDTLKNKLYPKLVRSSMKQASYDAVTMRSAISHQRPLTINPGRNVLSEILHDQHSFCNVLGQRYSDIPFHLPSMGEVLQWCQEQVHRMEEDSKASCDVLPWSGARGSYWIHCVMDAAQFTPPWVLVGVLRANKKTACVQLVDQTGSLDCMVVGTGDYSSHIGVVNSEACKNVGPQLQLEHFAEITHHGELIRVDRFHIMVECFLTDDISQSKSSKMDKYSTRPYLCFSMKETVKLKGSQRNSDIISSHLDPCNEKVKLLAKPGREKNLHQCHCDSASKFTSQSFILLHKDSLNLRGQFCYKPHLTFYALAVFVGNPWYGCCCQKVRSSFKTQGTDNEGCVNIRHVALALQGDSIRWYHMLYPGQSYVLVKRGQHNTSAFDMCLKPAGLKRAVETTGTRQCIMVDGDTEIFNHMHSNTSPEKMLADFTFSQLDKIQTDLASAGHIPHFLSVSQVLTEWNSLQKLVCVQGVIVHRMFTSPSDASTPFGLSQQQATEWQHKNLGVSVPGDRTTHLVLADTVSRERLNVYMNTKGMAYPLGLLPGACVQLEKVECRLSKEGRHYCQYLVASCCTVISYSSRLNVKDLEEAGHSCNIRTYQRATLLRLHELGDQVERAELIRMTCHVEHVKRVMLQVRCSTCGHCMVQSCCGCAQGQSAAVFSAKASVLVDDGTGTAVLHCDSNNVRELFKLSPVQWSALETCVAQMGQVTYESFSQLPHHYGLEGFLHRICQHPDVLRSITICANKYSKLTSKGKKFTGIHNMVLEDFEERTLRCGEGSVTTYCRPLVNMQCLTLRTADATGQLTELLADQPVPSST